MLQSTLLCMYVHFLLILPQLWNWRVRTVDLFQWLSKVNTFWKGHKILTTVHAFKSKVKILQTFVAFSEYMNFKALLKYGKFLSMYLNFPCFFDSNQIKNYFASFCHFPIYGPSCHSGRLQIWNNFWPLPPSKLWTSYLNGSLWDKEEEIDPPNR